MKLSFKKRIATYNLLATAILIAVSFIMIYTVVYYTSYQHLDSDISTEKKEIFKNLNISGDSIAMNKMEEWEEAEHKQLEANPVFIQIVDINGKTVFQSANLQRNIFLFNPNARKILFFNSTVSNQKIRQGQFPVYNDKDKIIGQLTIGISRQESLNVLHNLFIVLCVVFITIVSVLYFIMYFVASRAIAPIQGLINSASQITYTNLDSRLPLPDNKDEIFRLAATINELLHRLEVSFLQQKQFISDASHEMQTPLAAIKGTMEVLLRKPRTQQYYEDKAREVLIQTDRLSLLYDQLLQLARLESNILTVHKKDILLFSLIRKIESSYTSAIDEKSIKFHNNIPKDFSVKADEMMLERILDNLIANAVKYNVANGTVSCSWDASTHSILIEDTGIGIGRDQLPFLFNPFYRADDSRSTQIPGSGLGLSIVKRLCGLQNIDITVESTKGKGTAFRLHFIS